MIKSKAPDPYVGLDLEVVNALVHVNGMVQRARRVASELRRHRVLHSVVEHQTDGANYISAVGLAVHA